MDATTHGHLSQYDQPAPTSSRRKRTIRHRLQTGQHHFNKWLDNTSIHGIVHVFKGKSRFRRLLWLVIFVGSALGCIGILGYDIAIWARDPSTTTITFKTLKEGQTFPAVTICNLNPIKRFSAPPQTVELLSKFGNPTSGFVETWPYSSVQSNQSCSVTRDSLTDEERRDTLLSSYSNGGHQINDFIVYCGFAGNDGNVIDCQDTLQPILTSFGICYTFNSPYSNSIEHKVSQPGPAYGLNVILNISQNDYPIVSQSSVGAKVSIHPRGVVPIPHETGITLSTGTNTYIAVETLQHIDDTRTSSCIKSKSLSFFPTHPYSVSTCRVNALYAKYASQCNCTMTARQYANTHNCTVGDVCCLMEEFTHFDPSTECPPSCNYVSYNVKTSFSRFPGDELAQSIAMESESTVRDVHNNLLSFHVYFDQMQVTELHTDYTYTFANLLADMGGLLGLFIGASVISLLEVAMLIFDFLKSLLLNPKMKKVVKDLENKINLPNVELKEPIGEEDDDTEIAL